MVQGLVDDLRELELLIERTTAQFSDSPIQNVDEATSKFKEILSDIEKGEAQTLAAQMRVLADSPEEGSL